MAKVQLIDLLNDLEKEEEINKRIQKHLKDSDDKMKMYNLSTSGRFTTTAGSMPVVSTIFGNPFGPGPFGRLR